MRILILLTLLPFCTFSQTKINYKVFYEKNMEERGLKIQVDYVQKTASDSTVFFYNNSVWGEQDVFNSLMIFEEENKAISFKKFPEVDQIRIYHPKGKKVSLTYRIRQDFKDPDYNAFFRPVVKNDYFVVLGQSLFAIPEYFTDDNFNGKIEATVEWIGFPEKFVIQNTFATQVKKQTIKATIWDEFYKSLFVGGDYRLYEFKDHQKPVYFAIRGEWYNGYTDEYLFSNLQKAIQSQRDFWKDYSQDYFAVIMTPTVSQADSSYMGNSTTGTALKNGFMIQSTNNPFNSKEVYLHIIHHELMHNWIGGAISNEHGSLNYWFSEGFTDYYSYKNQLQVGVLTFDEWINAFNENVIAMYWENPKRNIPNYVIKDDYWKDRKVSKVPYGRGAIFAFWLDNQILMKSNYTKSLDDLMREILAKCTKDKVKFTDELLIDLVSDYLQEDISYFFQKYVIDGKDLDLVNEKWVDGFEFKMKDNIPVLVSTKGSETKYILK